MGHISTVKPGYFGKGSVEVAPPAREGEGPTRRLAIAADKLVTEPFEGLETVCDIISYAATTHGTNNAMGYRDIVEVRVCLLYRPWDRTDPYSQIHEEEKDVTKIVNGKTHVEKKKWKYFQLSEYKYLNFLQVQEAVSEVARGLLDLGITKDDVFNVYAATRYVSGYVFAFVMLIVSSV